MDDNGKDYVMEYDCNDSSYSIHMFSRRPTMNKDVLQSLITKVNTLGLNSLGNNFTATNQTGCW